MRILASLALASSLVGCASESTSIEPPETLVDGAADYWSSPTPFGALYEDQIQRGEIASNVQFPSWELSVSGDAALFIYTATAPTDEPELTRSNVFLYQQRDDGTWRRIARSSDARNEMGHLFKSVQEGQYRVIVTRYWEDQLGEFQIGMRCDGPGCAEQNQCLVREGFFEARGIHRGSFRDVGGIELNSSSALSPIMEAQLIAAVNESSSTVTNVADAFAAVDGEVVNYVRFRDELTSRNVVAIEYGAGENSFGAFFLEESSTVAAAIHDGFIEGCTLVPRTCVFGQRMGEAAHMEYMTELDEVTYTSSAGVSAMLGAQMAKVVDVPTVDEAISGVGEFRVTTFQKNDNKRWVQISYDAGGTPMGAFFPENSDEIVATISDGDIYNCSAVYE